MRTLITKKGRLLSFGVLATFFTASGQIFLIAFFIPPMREDLHLSQTMIAGLFFFGTVASAFMLPVLGMWLDRTRPIRFVVVTGALLTLGCVTLGTAHTALALFIGFFLVRNFGQGGLAMAAQTMMARLDDKYRGKALGITNLGYPISEALLPGLVSTVIVVFGWRSGWMMLAALLIFVFLPLVPFLIRHEPHPHKQHTAEDGFPTPVPARESWPVSRVLRDRRFHFLLIPILITPGVLSALFFHHMAIMAWKGWDPLLLPAGFVVYAVCRAIVSFFSGPLTDYFTARKIFFWNLVPLSFAVAVLWLAQNPFWIFLYFAGAGLTMGFGMTVGNALYAELYGTRYLGSIRGVISFSIVLTTAVAPLLLGYGLDHAWDLSRILGGMTVLAVAGIFCTAAALRE